MGGAGPHPLDNPALAALEAGPQARFAERRGRVLRYPVDMSPFAGVPSAPDSADWADAAALVGPGGLLVLAGYAAPPPEHWEQVFRIPGVQLTGEALRAEADPEAVPLTAADVPEMLDLVARTRPGPFLPRTVEMGAYLGIRRDGALVAMAGERMRPPGWTEISAVCTDPAFRGQGLAARLVRAVAVGIRARGDVPFLHAALENADAIRLYEALGFRVRRKLCFLGTTVPGAAVPDATVSDRD
ncbi:GNAT family N-acetyltransferase [Streptacidiphilus cavernicola]|uniref:GNAT family N-acetyltransferase n=1 Tax=Streptacidiphilus cavernicola TaxID=3342716 RepID=A0ABV6W084_9ACTN